ncbi:MAG TPA: hypothetical protein VF042_04945 [Gemmatimonadaceae bacterium]
MLKWLGGCLVLVIVLIGVGSWYAMRSIRQSLEPDGSARVTIAATPQRIYASLSNGDSSATWMATGSTVIASRRGPLVVGDSIRIEMRQSLGVGRPIVWHVSELKPDQVVALQLMNETKTQVIATRRDSLVSIGDSTTVVSTITTALPDSVRNKAGMAGDMMMSMFRIQSKLELQSLKARIEGRVVPLTK